MTKVLAGLIAALILIAGIQTWRLDGEQKANAILLSNNEHLEDGLEKAKQAFNESQKLAERKVRILSARAEEREHHINELTEKNKQLASIPDDSCLDRRMPDSVIRMLDGAGDNSAKTRSGISSKQAAGGLFNARIEGSNLSSLNRIRDGPA